MLTVNCLRDRLGWWPWGWRDSILFLWQNEFRGLGLLSILKIHLYLDGSALGELPSLLESSRVGPSGLRYIQNVIMHLVGQSQIRCVVFNNEQILKSFFKIWFEADFD